MILNPYFGGDAYFGNVALLLHMEGANGARIYTDSSSYARSLSETGVNETSTVNFKYGTSSTLMNNGAIYPADSATLELGSSDWTVEFWCWTSSNTGIAIGKGNGAGFYSFSLVSELNGGFRKLRVRCSSDGSTYGVDSYFPSGSADGWPTSQWTHIAVCRNGSNIEVFVDGVSLGTAAVSGTLVNDTEPWLIGRAPGGAYQFGNLDEFRITIGVARYTGTFTPPTAAFPDA